MTKKLKTLGKIIVAFLMSFAFAIALAACDTAGGHTHVDSDGDKVCDGCGKPMEGTPDPDDKEDDGKDPKPTPDPDDEDEIPKVPAGAVQISEAKGDLEACYAVWTEVEGGAKTYNVYVKPEDGSYTRLDRQLVRK